MSPLNCMYRCLVTMMVLLGTSTLFAQDLHVIQLNDYVAIEYSSELQQPIRATYQIPCSNGGVDRDNFTFFLSDNINFSTSDGEDYVDNIWDRGHLAPASAFSCTEELLETTFSYVNVALQHQGLNRGVWSKLETFERNLSVFFPDLKVDIYVLFDENSEKLLTGATVPTAFRKVLTFDGKSYVFDFPNQNTTGTNFMEYLK